MPRSAVTAIPAVSVAPTGLPGHGRGNRDRVLLDVGDALAPCIEGISLADESSVAFQRIVNAAIAGNRGAVVNLANNGQARADLYRAEFARMAGRIEPDEDSAA